jgi:hypothetical protein
LTVFTFDKWPYFTILQSNIHSGWAWKYGTTLKSDLIYAPSDIVNIYPFPQNLIPQKEQQLENIGEAYHENRRQLMLGMQLGLTDTYNLFHKKNDLNFCKIKSGKVLFISIRPSKYIFFDKKGLFSFRAKK